MALSLCLRIMAVLCLLLAPVCLHADVLSQTELARIMGSAEYGPYEAIRRIGAWQKTQTDPRIIEAGFVELQNYYITTRERSQLQLPPARAEEILKKGQSPNAFDPAIGMRNAVGALTRGELKNLSGEQKIANFRYFVERLAILSPGYRAIEFRGSNVTGFLGESKGKVVAITGDGKVYLGSLREGSIIGSTRFQARLTPTLSFGELSAMPEFESFVELSESTAPRIAESPRTRGVSQRLRSMATRTNLSPMMGMQAASEALQLQAMASLLYSRLAQLYEENLLDLNRLNRDAVNEGIEKWLRLKGYEVDPQSCDIIDAAGFPRHWNSTSRQSEIYAFAKTNSVFLLHFVEVIERAVAEGDAIPQIWIGKLVTEQQSQSDVWAQFIATIKSSSNSSAKIDAAKTLFADTNAGGDTVATYFATDYLISLYATETGASLAPWVMVRFESNATHPFHRFSGFLNYVNAETWRTVDRYTAPTIDESWIATSAGPGRKSKLEADNYVVNANDLNRLNALHAKIAAAPGINTFPEYEQVVKQSHVCDLIKKLNSCDEALRRFDSAYDTFKKMFEPTCGTPGEPAGLPIGANAIERMIGAKNSIKIACSADLLKPAMDLAAGDAAAQGKYDETLRHQGVFTARWNELLVRFRKIHEAWKAMHGSDVMSNLDRAREWCRDLRPISSTPVPTTTVAPMPTTTVFPMPTTTVFPMPTTTAFPMPTTTAFPMPTTTVFPMPTTTVFPMPTTTVFPMPTTTVFPMPTTTVLPMPTTTVFPMPTTTVFPMPTTTVFPMPTTTVFPMPTTTVFPMPTTTVFPMPTTTVFPMPTTTVFPTPTSTIFPTPTSRP